MEWFNRNSLYGMAEGVNESLAALAVSMQSVAEEIYANMEALEKRMGAVEQNAVTIRQAGDRKLDVLPVLSVSADAGKGEDETDGNE